LTIADHYHSLEPLDSIMSRITHREYLTRLAWIDSRWEEPPSRIEWYLMQIAAEVKKLFRKKTQGVTPESMVIRFIRKLIKPKSDLDGSAKTETLEDRWGPLVGKKVARSEVK
jgi:hypothetical protein